AHAAQGSDGRVPQIDVRERRQVRASRVDRRGERRLDEPHVPEPPRRRPALERRGGTAGRALMTARHVSTLWAGVSVALAAAALLLLARYAPVQTDLLALLPPTERSAAAERAVAAMRDAAGNRAVFLIGDAQAPSARRAAARFAAELRRSGAFASVQFEVPDIDPQRLTAPHREFRFGLLTDADRAVLVDGSFEPEQWLLRRLNDPFRTPLGGGVAQDPFGFFGNFIASLPYRQLRLDLEDGLLVARADAKGARGIHVLVSAELAGHADDDPEGAPRH